METSKSLNNQIVQYLDFLNVDQKMALLGIMKTFTDKEDERDIWENQAFVTEIENRVYELESGATKKYSWDEVKSITRQSIADLKKHEI